MSAAREVWITGIGILSAAGDRAALHAPGSIETNAPQDPVNISGYPVLPLCAVDFSKQIPKVSEQRQMSRWQKIGVYAAGVALDDAGLTGREEFLERTHLLVAAGNGDRDCSLDLKILEGGSCERVLAAGFNESLLRGLRPTLYLGELSNLLAGNISIVHHVTGSSRTFKGEEIAGVSVVENAYRRILADQGDVFLVGGALNAERDDLLLGYELGQFLLSESPGSVWSRRGDSGGLVLGSVGAFLVIEAREHAEARGQAPYARITAVRSDRSRREAGQIQRILEHLCESFEIPRGPLAVISGASGVEPATSGELAFLQGLAAWGCPASIRAHGSRLGHGVEAHFPSGICLGALALSARRFYEPMPDSICETAYGSDLDKVLVTGAGHWRGEGLALLERVT